MYPISHKFRAALQESHTMVSRLIARSHAGEETELEIIDGSVSANLDSTVRRGLRATFRIPVDTPLTDQERSVLSPYSSVYLPRRGIRFPDGTEELVPLGIFYASTLRETDENTFELNGLDYSSRCQAGLMTPHFIPTGFNTAEAIPPLIGKKLPFVTFNLMPSNYTTPALLLREGDSVWDEAIKLAKATGCDLYFDRLGVCTSSPVRQDAGFVEWTFEEGKNADFWAPARDLDSDSKPNVVVVVGTSSRASIRGEASDLDPTSPTYRYGPYGEKVKTIESDRVTSKAQASDMAKAELQRNLGPSDEVSFSAIPNPALDLSDTVGIVRERISLAHKFMVSDIEIPLTSEREMTVTCRRYLHTIAVDPTFNPFEGVVLSMEESFEGGSWPVGPDLVWEEGHGARAFSYLNGPGLGSTPETDGSDPTKRTLSVVGGELAIAGPPDSGLTQGDLAFSRCWGLARTTSELTQSGMRVTGVVSERSSGSLGFPEWCLLARSEPDPDNLEDLADLYQLGYLAYFMDTYIQMDVHYIDSTGTMVGNAFLDSGATVVPNIAIGDELVLEVTGTGASTLVTCKINGVTYMEHDATSIGAALSGSDTVDMLPEGKRAGVGFYHIGASSGGDQKQDETFNGAYDLSWTHPISGGPETIVSNALTVSANNTTGGIISTADGPHIGHAAQIIEGTTASTFADLNGNKFTILALCSGTDTSDWRGIGAEIKCTATTNIKDFRIGFLNPGDATGTLVNWTAATVNVFTLTGNASIASAPFQVIVWDAPVDGSGVGQFKVSLLWRGFNIFNKTAIAGNGGTGFRWGTLLFAPTGATAGQRAALDGIDAVRPASEEIWDHTDDNQTRFESWKAEAI